MSQNPRTATATATAAPSTDWREQLSPDDDARYSGYAEQFTELQRRKSERFGNGRALHRKHVHAARGLFEVAADLPAFARHGLFATPGRHEVLLRLSNGGMDVAHDRQPDVRGFAFKVFGVTGDSALGNGPARSQDFLLINHPAFAFPNSHEFVGFVVAASHGPVKLIGHLASRYGLFGAPRQLAKLVKSMGRPFTGFATETLHSAAPIACGPYAVRVRLVPEPANAAGPASGHAARPGRHGWGADFNARLLQGPLAWQLQLQPYTDEATTPIEDASVDWPTPYSTVGRLVLPRQDADAAEGRALAQQAEAAVFDPWQALVEHRPLGDVQRARKVVYFESQKGRGAA